MKILIYKRTHKGDPDQRGIFGIDDCMGRVRNWNYDAVIGIGGKSPWKRHEDIKYKVNWIGVEPKKKGSTQRGAKLVFAHFELFEEKGQDIKENYPYLFEYMYGSRKRFDMSSELPEEVLLEVEHILNSVKNSLPSQEYDAKDVKNSHEVSKHTAECTSCFGGKKVEIEIEDQNI